MAIYFGNPVQIESIPDVISLYGNREFESPTRSTLPMLSLLFHAPCMFNEIVRELGMPDNYDIFLEYKVRPPQGRGTASHTDVMLKSGEDVLAIEAKWTEPMYVTVAQWLNEVKNNDNREAVLGGWLGLLEQQCRCNLDLAGANNLIYQMVHRAASAAASGLNPRLSYFLFKMKSTNMESTEDGTKTDQMVERLTELWNFLGEPEGFPFSVVEIEIEPTEIYETKIRPLPRREADTRNTIIGTLQNNHTLFNFPAFSIRAVEQQ